MLREKVTCNSRLTIETRLTIQTCTVADFCPEHRVVSGRPASGWSQESRNSPLCGSFWRFWGSWFGHTGWGTGSRPGERFVTGPCKYTLPHQFTWAGLLWCRFAISCSFGSYERSFLWLFSPSCTAICRQWFIRLLNAIRWTAVSLFGQNTNHSKTSQPSANSKIKMLFC